jgi:RimJ/RimL family protein N-acetyltransferase
MIIRQWIKADLEKILQVYGDQEVVRWVGDRVPLNLEQATKWLEVTQRNYDIRGYGMFTIIDKSNNETIGFGGLVHPDQPCFLS